MPLLLAIGLIGAAAVGAYCLGYAYSARRARLTLEEYHRAQAQLRKLTTAVTQSPSTVMITDLQGRIEYVNPKFTELTGYTPEEVYGQTPRILNSGHTPPEVYESLWQTITAGREWRGEFLNRKKNGELYWEFASICGVTGDDGQLTHYVAVKEDITARKEAEAALQASEAKHEAILAAIPDLVLRFDRDGTYLDVRGNLDLGLRVTTEGPSYTIGKTLYDLLPEPEARLIHDAIRRALDTGAMQIIEYTLPTVSGQRDFEARIVSNGPDEVVSVARDITMRRKLEIALNDSELKYRNVAERANDAIVIVQDGAIRYCNPQLERMIGWSSDDIVNQPFEPFIAPEAREDVRSKYESRIAGEDVPARYETQLLHKDGHIVDVEINSGRMDYSGRPAVLAFIRDVTERKRAEAERERLINELNAFAHTVAHDLKSPLHGLIGYASLLADGLEDFSQEELKQYLRVIEKYGFKMNGIIEDVMLLSSVRSLEEVEVNALAMDEIVESALNRLDYIVREREATITLQDRPWPRAYGYAPWIEQVWVNYLSNALKYGGDPPQIEVGAETLDNGTVRYWVRDHGAGISPEDQQRLFTRFTRVGTQKKIEGHGLGLSIVQRIVKKLGGDVGVHSAEGDGAEFYFTLPAARESVHEVK